MNTWIKSIISTKLSTRTSLIALVFFIVWGCAFTATVRASGQYYKIDYPASNVEGELKIAVTHTLWIPNGLKTLRGIIVHQHGAGITASKEGATATYDLHWQALATLASGIRNFIAHRTSRCLKCDIAIPPPGQGRNTSTPLSRYNLEIYEKRNE